MKCLQCDINDISYWCLDKFCSINLICDQCKIRHGKVEKITENNKINTNLQKNKIKTWIRKMIKQMLMIIERMYSYYVDIEKIFQNEENEQNQNIKILKKRLQQYSQYLQFNPQIQSALFNLNNQLLNYNFPEAKTFRIDEKDVQEQLNNCKKLIQEKQYTKAAQEVQIFNSDESKYFQIECQILQNNLKHALDLSKKAIESQLHNENLQANQQQQQGQQNNESQLHNENLQANLQLQQAKILHKQKEYRQALQSLKNIEPNQLKGIDKCRFELQLGMKFNQIEAITLIKCGQFNLGQKQIKDIKKEISDLQVPSNGESDGNQFATKLKQFIGKYPIKQYQVGNFEFNLALAKAFLKIINDDGISSTSSILNEDQNQQDSQYTSKQILMGVKNIYQEILNEEPTNQKALYGLSQILIRNREFIEARELLYQLLQLNPKYRKAESCLLFIKLKLQDQQKDDEEDQFQTFEGCLGYIYGLCYGNSQKRYPSAQQQPNTG